MNAQVIGTTHFFHVPVRVFPKKSGGGYDFIYDFPSIDVTYARAVILYELVEAPVGLVLESPTISSGGEFVPFVTAMGLVAGFVDFDMTQGTYTVQLPYQIDGKSYQSDPQVINNPIKR